jgi:hypothetical protein
VIGALVGQVVQFKTRREADGDKTSAVFAVLVGALQNGKSGLIWDTVVMPMCITVKPGGVIPGAFIGVMLFNFALTFLGDHPIYYVK